jgi:RecJ-like exonuclease
MPLAILNENEEPCPACEGSGKMACPTCNGAKSRIVQHPYPIPTTEHCFACKGTGEQTCSRCHGAGKIQKELPAEQLVLTPEQEDFVWGFVCSKMAEGDRNPEEVVAQDYNGDRSRYLRDMATHHGILFCSVHDCGISNKNDPLVFNKDVEIKGIHLCGKHAVDYQVRWRVDFPGEPNVRRYLCHMQTAGAP